jgi:hypothetical protein
MSSFIFSSIVPTKDDEVEVFKLEKFGKKEEIYKERRIRNPSQE